MYKTGYMERIIKWKSDRHSRYTSIWKWMVIKKIEIVVVVVVVVFCGVVE